MYEISGYDLRPNDRISGKKGGGCCTYIRQDCSVSELKIDVAFPNNTEVYIYKFKAPYTRPIIYVSVYNPPNVCKNEFLLAFVDCLLTHLTPIRPEIIMMGDFNINLLSKDNYTLKCNNICAFFNLSQLIDSPTRTTEVSKTLIDHVYVSKSTPICKSGAFSLTHSDHYCIYTVRKSKASSFPSRILKSRGLKNADWGKIHRDLATCNWDFISDKDCTAQVSSLESVLLKTVNKFTPLKKSVSRENRIYG